MKIFQELTMDAEISDLDTFLNDLVASLKEWQVNQTIQERMERFHDLSQSRRIAIDTPAGRGLRSATLFLFVNNEGNHASVGNIIPDKDQLTTEEYNAILRAFNEECIQMKAEAFHVCVTLSSDEYLPENTLSPQNMQRLKIFSGLANKNTGSHHPHDYRRWIEFIAFSIRDGQILNYNLLRQWLIEQGFPGDVASDMCREYQFSVDLWEQLGSTVPNQDKAGASR